MFFLFLAGTRTGAAPEIEVELDPPRSLKSGETGQLEIQARWKTSEALYFFTPPRVPLENLSLEEMGESNETFQRGGEEWKQKVFRLRLKAEKPGTGHIGAFRLNYIDPVTQKGGSFDVPEMDLRIRHDLARFYPAAALVAGTALLTAVLSGWIWRRRKPAVAIEPEELGPEGHYLSRLKSAATTLAEAERILRDYLRQKYAGGVEGKLSLKDSKILEKIWSGLEESRFAGRSVSAEEERRLLGEIIQFIEDKRVLVQSPDQN